jgi:TRAP-type C4-dicarboxylate transport system substrate-binding protein
LPITIRFGGYQPARSVHSRAVRTFGQALQSRLGAGIDFQFTENVPATGRKAADLLPMVEGEELDLCYFSSSYLVARVPSLGLFDLPFEFGDRAAAYAVLDGETGRRLADDVAAATGFRVLAYWDNGFRHFSNGRHAIIAPADCRGLTIRTLDNAMHQCVFRALGFEPVVIDVKDLAAAVAERRVDAQENPLTNLINFNLHKTHRFVTLSGHFFGVAPVLCNKARFDAWPADVQSAVRDSLAQATSAQRRNAAEEDERCLAELLADGVVVTRVDQFDRTAFLAAVADIREEARKGAGRHARA